MDFLRLPLIIFSVSGLYCGLTSLSTILVMSGQNHHLLGINLCERNVHRAPVGSGRLAENSVVILHGIAVVRVVRVRLKILIQPDKRKFSCIACIAANYKNTVYKIYTNTDIKCHEITCFFRQCTDQNWCDRLAD